MIRSRSEAGTRRVTGVTLNVMPSVTATDLDLVSLFVLIGFPPGRFDARL
jgi:hypothetical protein